MALTLGRWNTTGSTEWTGSETLYAADLNPTIGSAYHPIGTLVSWDKTSAGSAVASNLPDCWVECNGQTLSDANSPLNGEILPDLNGFNLFLRGGTSAGSSLGSEHNHTHGDTNWFYTDNSTNIFHVLFNHSHAIGTTDHQPPYYNVVWLIRTK